MKLYRINKGGDDQSTDLTASFNMDWQCKGSRKSYASNSGHAVVIGQNSGKISGFSTRITICKQYEKDNSVVHDCRINWGGSSKAMERNAAVELLNKTKSPEDGWSQYHHRQ